MSKLDELLGRPAALDPATLRRARQALAAELAATRGASWQADVRRLIGTLWAVAAAVAAAMIAGGQTTLPSVLERAVPIALVLLLGSVGAWAAVAPRRTLRLSVGVMAAALGMAAVVWARGEGHPSTSPEWVCTVSHVAIALGPVALALWALRRGAPHPLRSLAAGLAVGSLCAAVGELACTRGWQHVAVYHLGAWAAVAALTVVAGALVKPRSFAP